MANYNQQNLDKSTSIHNDNCKFQTTLSCSLKIICLSSNISYNTTVTMNTTSTIVSTCIGSTANQFKIWYNHHTHTFYNLNNKNGTSLYKHIWSLKFKKILYSALTRKYCHISIRHARCSSL